MGNGTVDLVAENPGAEIIDIDLIWDAPRSGEVEAKSPRRPSERRPDPMRGIDPRWLVGLAALVFVVMVFATSDSAEEAPSTDPEASSAEATVVDPAAAPDPAAAAGVDPDLDLAAAIGEMSDEQRVTAFLEVQVDPDEADKYALLRPLEMVPGNNRIAYIGADGHPIVLDTSSGIITSVRSEVQAEGDDGHAIVRDVTGTIAFDPEQPDSVLRMGTDVQLVRRHTGELLVVALTASGIEYGAFVPGESDPRQVLPATVEIEVIPSVGVYVTPRSGGVMELTADGLERITPHELVATNGTRLLEYRRELEGTSYWVVDPDGREWELSDDLFDFGRGPTMSPDGEWLFLPRGLEIDDFPALVEIETGRVLDFEQRVDELQSVWAPDSSFAAMLDSRRDCVYLFFTSGNNGCISLGRLAIPALPESQLVVFGGPSAPVTVAPDTRTSATSD